MTNPTIMLSMIAAATQKTMINVSAVSFAMLVTLIGEVAAPVVSPNMLVDLRTVCAVGGVVVSGVWWLSKKFQSIEDRLDLQERGRVKRRKDDQRYIRAQLTRRRKQN